MRARALVGAPGIRAGTMIMPSRLVNRLCTLLAASLLATPVASAAPLGPGAPGGVTATATAAGEISVEWSPASSVTGVVAYRVYHVGDDGTLALASEVGGDVSAWADVGVPPGERRTYVVSAVDLIGEGPASEPASATAWTVPEAPTGVSVASGPGAIGEASVSWAAPSDDGGSALTAYNVYRDGALVATVAPENLSWTDTSLTPFHAYSYQVTAINVVGEGAASDAACGMPSPWVPDLGCQSVV